ncbi:vWA domain-containing protein [Fuerstiella marisgermanici]|uniref:Calcium-activated chloride channel protein 1 n=1 Tax=Fuerstiella marisgermanici TaxID=1891926 RepID=A0A1P8WBE2_9PLAN|nr:vWA domain-containing protein [Fuerstiella marisgermanici]APZ91343.1 calcium-activated chloride channel protein 1 [Fuerstiella marisgermanici]
MRKLPFTRTLQQPSSRRQGAILMLIVLCVPVILAFSAFAINIAWMQLTRTELRTATDAAARAGSRTLSLSQSPATARASAKAAASRNTVAGDGLTLNDADVVFGSSERTGVAKWSFTPAADSDPELNGVRIVGSRTAGSPDGPITMLFAGMFDRSNFEPVKSATASQLDRDVMLVLDRSGSMGTVTPGGTRWTDLKLAVDAFLAALALTPQDEFVGLATYSTTSTLDENLALSYTPVQTNISSITPNGWTAIGLGLQDGITGVLDPSYTRPNAAKTILLMTDGNHNTDLDPVGVAQTAHDTHNITVHTITFSSGADQTHMQQVAAAGGGKHWHADDQAQLISVFEEIANNLPTLITE